MCNAINGLAIVIIFSIISMTFGIREYVWHLVITLSTVVSTFYSANYFSALEYRNDKRRFFLLLWVIISIGANFIHVFGL